jgi:thioredoxin 1
MAEDIEEIRRQKLAELRNRAETGGVEESAESLSEPIHIDGDAELS